MEIKKKMKLGVGEYTINGINLIKDNNAVTIGVKLTIDGYRDQPVLWGNIELKGADNSCFYSVMEHNGMETIDKYSELVGKKVMIYVYRDTYINSHGDTIPCNKYITNTDKFPVDLKTIKIKGVKK